jgi:hypothetical protein
VGAAEWLNAKAMQGRRAVQQYRMLANDFFEQIPNQRVFAFNATFRFFDGLCFAHLLKAIEDEWLEELKRHFFRQSALVQFKLRSDHDHRATGVINAFAEQV